MKISVVKNASHTLAYSLVALQEMNLAYKYPIIFWNCACLITDSGGAEENDEEPVEEIVDIYESEDFENYEYIDSPDKTTKIKKKRTKSTDYKKIATAIGKMTQAGIKIEPPDINNSNYTFTPDVKNNSIFFGLSGILNVGEEVITDIINNRPFSSPKDFILKVKPKKQAMISLIKSGAFDKLIDRKLCMAWYIWETCDKKSRITLQNMNGLIKYNIIPEDNEKIVLARRVYEFNRYLKAICKYDTVYYRLDERAINFLIEIDCESLINNMEYLEIKLWEKRVYQVYMNLLRDWISADKENILTKLNTIIFKEDWDKYATGSLSAWEMEVLCFYYHEHELAHVNYNKYGLSNFFTLPEEPEIDHTFKKNGKTINLFKLNKIFGTCIAKDKSKAIVTILTTTGVVDVKFRKEYFAMFDKQLSEKLPDGTKHVIEKSWFNRGNMLMIQGIRQGDNFIAKKYNSVGGHQLYRISEFDEKGNITLQSQRYSGGIEEDV